MTLSPEPLVTAAPGRLTEVPPAAAAVAASCQSRQGTVVVRMFGPLSIEHDDVPLAHPHWRRERVRALFALLVHRRVISRREAAGLLWPDHEPLAAANNLRVSLTYLQRMLRDTGIDEGRAGEGPAAVRSVLRATGTEIALAPAWRVDVREFEQSLHLATELERAGDTAGTMAALRTAADWYRGDWLACVQLSHVAEIERERLRSRFVEAVVRLGSLVAATGDPTEAERLALRALREDPWSELAAALVIGCRLARGDRPAATRQFIRTCALLAELGLPPSEALTRFGHVLRGTGRLGAPPLL